MDLDFDSKYGENSTFCGESTIEFFPDMDQFESDLAPMNQNEIHTEWALIKIGTLQSRLDVLQSERNRWKNTNKFFHKFPNHIILNLANEVFGYSGWCSEIIQFDINVVSDGESFSGKALAVVRVVLSDGTFRDSSASAKVANLPHRYMCYNNCRKQAVSNATSNAILSFKDLLLDNEVRIKLEPKGW